jgi:glycosyltransferase involved in cell wall biosynthesis
MRAHSPIAMTSYHRPGLLQVLPSLQSGGVERGTVDIAAAAAKGGFRSFVASEGGPMVTQLYYNDAKHFTLPLATKNPVEIYMNSLRLAKLIRENNIAIVHARSRAPAWSAYLAAKQTGCKLVTTFHGVYNFHSAMKKYYNAIMTKGSAVIAISEFTAAHIKEHYPIAEEQLVTIPRGADMELFDPKAITSQRLLQQITKFRIPEGRRIIMLPGRITQWKGHQFLLDALRALPKEQYFCLFVGDDKGHVAYREQLEKTIAQYGLQDNVRIAPNTKDIAAAYMLADVVVSASVQPEAFGRVAIEAQAMGRPLVATAIGGSCETVIPGVTGWLVPPHDVPAMSQALVEALSLGKEARDALALKARQHIADHFSLDGMCRRTLEVYRKVLG